MVYMYVESNCVYEEMCVCVCALEICLRKVFEMEGAALAHVSSLCIGSHMKRLCACCRFDCIS